jgi:cellulose synthase/poly-beta-1,6-N-acetylglucosamine synthase-like glycosyltransferase
MPFPLSISPQVKKILTFVILYGITAFLIFATTVGTPTERNDFPIFRLVIITFATILLTKYFVYMVVSPWYDVVTLIKRKLLREKNPTPYTPRVSVIVPAWNEEVGLVKTVKTILASEYRNLEIVVVNDGSTDNSDRLMSEFLAEYEAEIEKKENMAGVIDIIYKYKKNGGKGKALNDGILLSTGDIIISIDADCVLLPDTVGNIVAHFEDPEVMAAVGNVKVGNQKSLLETLQYLEFLFTFYFKKADSLFNTIYIIGGAAGAFRRIVFEQLGPYSSENITEDIELSVRIQKAGMKIVYAADAIVYTEGAATFKGLAAQRLRWKRGRFETFYEHRNLFFSEKSLHNKILSWLVLPLALFGDIQLFFEVFFLLFLYIYSFITHDFSSFISGIIVVSSMFFVQLWDDKRIKKGEALQLYFLAPIGWLLFYITTVVEYRALVKAIWGLATKEKLAWQKWNRVGIAVQK